MHIYNGKYSFLFNARICFDLVFLTSYVQLFICVVVAIGTLSLCSSLH